MAENKAQLFALEQARDYVKSALTGLMLAFHDTDVAHLYEEQFDELLHELDVDIAELTPPVSKWYVFNETDCFGSFTDPTDAGSRFGRAVIDGHKGIKIEYLSDAEYENLTQGKH